jgi:hypothetical protein
VPADLRPTEAGYNEIALNGFDHSITTGRNVKEAIEILMAIGPRLRGNRAVHMHERVKPSRRGWLSC